MAADYSFSFTDVASADLDEILNYIRFELDNPTASKHFLEKLEKTISLIRTFPFSGSLINNPYVRRNDIRKTLVGNYVLYYLPDSLKKEILILRVVYGQREKSSIEENLL